jgi:peptide deformylase
MIFPIFIYTNPILRKKTKEINKDYPELDRLISDMWETMYNANGIGLSAPQIGKSIRLFIIGVDALNFKKVFINPVIINKSEKKEYGIESCLSFPAINENILRYSEITIKYFNENFEPREETYNNIIARIIQHEYDHLENILLIDYFHPIRRAQISKQLTNIRKRKVKTKYSIKL